MRYFTIKRINKGLKPTKGINLPISHFTIKRINKGLKRLFLCFGLVLILP